MADEEGPIRSPQEVAAEISAFGPAQWSRLERVAAKYAWKAGWLADDLVNEACARAVAGDRRCPMHVDAVRFLAEAMRGIADDEANKLLNQARHVMIKRGVGSDDCGVDVADSNQNAEQVAITEEEATVIREEIMALFKDDKLILDMIDGFMAGYSASEIREVLEVEAKTYNSARRKMRRTLDKAFPQRRRS